MCIRDRDVLYMTRIQRERFFNEEEYLRLKGTYELNGALLRAAPADMPVLHPLPRIDEITLDVDSDPRAAYFDQVHNGVYVRMALILSLLGLPDPVTGHIVLVDRAAPAVSPGTEHCRNPRCITAAEADCETLKTENGCCAYCGQKL